MYVHKRAKLCFLASPRTASRAVSTALKQPAIGFLEKGSHHDGPEQGWDIQGLTCFTAVRNHWDTVVSWWYNARMFKKQTKPSLEWIAHFFAANRYYFRAGTMFWFRELIPNIIVLRYENLEDELNMLLGLRGLPKVTLPRFGISEERLLEVPVPAPHDFVTTESSPPDRITAETEKRPRHYSTYFDSKTRNFVEWCFLKEINALGYRFEEVPKWTK